MGVFFRTCTRLSSRPGRQGGRLVTGSLRPVAVPFVAAPPGGARVRARLRVSAEDEAVLRTVGAHLGSLARSCADGWAEPTRRKGQSGTPMDGRHAGVDDASSPVLAGSGRRLTGATPGLPGRHLGDAGPRAAVAGQMVTLRNDELLQSLRIGTALITLSIFTETLCRLGHEKNVTGYAIDTRKH
jgi:hypothetical protein